MRRRDFLLALASLPALRTATAQVPEFSPVLPGRKLVFPADYGAHPDFRTEWWYATGWLTLPDGSPLGFQSTFFRVRTGIGEDNPSAFAPRQLILAHAAIADPGLAGCATTNALPASVSGVPASPSARPASGSVTGVSSSALAATGPRFAARNSPMP